MGRLIFFIPIILIAIAIAVYFVLIPEIYGETVSFVDCLLADSTKIINTLRAGGKGLPSIRGILVLEIFWWVWSALFIASLFFVGKHLQNHVKFSEEAIMIKNDPYLAVQDALDTLKRNNTSGELNEVIISVKKLSEKLSYESDFGRGDANVIDCENDIAKSLKFLVLAAKNFPIGDSAENITKIESLINSINSLLSVRANLEKRR